MSPRSDMPTVLPASANKKSPNDSTPERRGQPRYPFTAAAEAYEPRAQLRVTGRCSDLAPGGCYVDTISPFPVGTVIKIRLVRDSREFEASAVVKYAHPSMGMGLAFSEIKRENQEILRIWIAELSGEQPPETVAVTAEPEPETKPMVEENASLRLAFNELVNLLVRKKTITENEGAVLLRQLFR
jgi:hypothetical protein